MNVGQMCQRNAITVQATDEIAAAARLMREKHVGFLVVVEPAGRRRPTRSDTEADGDDQVEDGT